MKAPSSADTQAMVRRIVKQASVDIGILDQPKQPSFSLDGICGTSVGNASIAANSQPSVQKKKSVPISDESSAGYAEAEQHFSHSQGGSSSH